MRFSAPLFFIVLAWSQGLAQGRLENIDAGLVALIDRIDAKSETIAAMQARFVYRKETNLLKEPAVQKGVFSMMRGEGMRFEFEPEEDLIVILTQEAAVSLSPAAEKASLIPIKKRKSDIAQRLLSDKLGSMLAFFNITRASGGESAVQRLELRPKKRKLKKRFDSISLWVNGDDLIYRVQTALKDGDVYDLRLEDIELGPPLEADLFDTAIPDHYEVSDRMDFILGSGVAF